MIDNLKNKLMTDGVVSLNTGKPRADMTIIRQILSLFNKTMDARKHHLSGDKKIQIVSDSEMFGSESIDWHTDQSYSFAKFNGTLLAYDFSEHPTYTEFVNMRVAYESLSPEQKNYYSGIVCTYGNASPNSRLSNDTANYPIANGNTRPLVSIHPITKLKSLYLSPLTLIKSNVKFDLDLLVRHCEMFKVRHEWKPGDIVLWDDLTMMHRRPAFHGRRQLFRANFRYE